MATSLPLDIDYLAMKINDYIYEHAPDDWKGLCNNKGLSDDCEFFACSNIRYASMANIPVPPKEYVLWRSVVHIPYNSSWKWDQKAIPHYKVIDARPEIQAEFKRRGITPR